MIEWQQIEDFPTYAVSELGEVDNVDLRMPMRTRVNNQGFVMVSLSRDHRQFTRSVAKLVATAFVPKEHEAFDTIIHLNGDHNDCRSMNLRWRTRPFTIRYHRMFEDLPLHVGVYIPATRERFRSLREACTKYGMVEQMAYRAMQNQEPVFPQGWILEPL